MSRSFAPRVKVIQYPGSPFLWAYWRWGGKNRYATLRTADAREAERRARAIEERLLRLYYGTLEPAAAPAATVKDVLDAYRRRLVAPRVSERHAEVQGERLDAWEVALGASVPASGVTSPLVDRWLTQRLTEVSPTTARNELVALKAAFTQAVKDGLLQALPFDVRAPKARRKGEEVLLPLPELRRLLKRADLSKPSGRCLWLAAYTGLRRADLAALPWGAIDRAGVVRWVTSKAERFVPLPLPRRAWAKLKPHRKGKDERVIGWTDDVISHKLPHGPHAYRHAFATYLAKGGVDPALVSMLLAHAGGVTAGYLHLGPEDLRKEVEKLPY